MALPVLRNQYVTLRELRLDDAATLLAQVTPPDVLRHIAQAPTTVEGFKSFIRWTRLQRRRRLHAAFGIVPAGKVRPVGILQFWPIELDYSTAEWGFVLGQQYWGTGLFGHSARLMLDFAFDTVGVMRMEARAALGNGRGNGALRKLGASPEGTLRGAFNQGGQVRDYVMWSILASEWRPTACGDNGQERR
jgi:RimJ/RimL family protein N-acetyltransferase